MKRRLLALVLVVSLIASMCTTAFAAQENAGEINYVSIGDSMANGYCFDGYEQGNGDKIDFFAGEGVYGVGAYPEQFADWLADETGKNVNHTKLAVSALRAEDLYFLLGGREEPQDGWQDQVNGYTEVRDDEALAAFYQEAVANADVITLGVGNASFGAYMLHRVTDALGVFGASLDEDEKVDLEDALVDLDEEQTKVILDAYTQLKAEMAKYVPADLAEEYNVDEVCGILAYTGAGFILNYAGSVEQIIKLNPDAEIILVGLMNTTYGMNITGEGFDPIPVGDIMDEFFGALNAYMAGLPAVKQLAGEWTEAKFYYADQPAPKFISQVFADLKDAGWGKIQDGRLSGDIVRERNITAYNDTLREMIAMAFGAIFHFDMNLPKISLDEVKAYEENPPVWTLKDYGYGFVPNGAGPIDTHADEKNLSIAIYLGIEDAVAESCDTLEIPLSGLMKIAGDLSSVFSGMDIKADDPNSTPETVREGLGTYLTSTEEFKGMCKIYALFKVGNGMSVHPTPEGHDQIAASVIDAYEAQHTAADETKDNLIVVAKALADLVAEYYDEAYAYAYAEAKAAGYIDTAVAGIDAAIAELVSIDLSGTEMTDEFKAELAGEIEEVIETLAAAKALINEADVLDQASLDALIAMLDEGGEAIENIKNLLKQAGVDVNDLVVTPALNKAYDELINVVIPAAKAAAKEIAAKAYEYLVALAEQAGEDLAEAYDAFVEAFLEFLPEADAWLYDWFYNNPDKVIAFFEENGEFFVENAEAAATVLGYIAYTFGPEVLEWVMENPEEALEQFVSWYEKYGERTWAMILVYLEELGVIDAAEDLYSCIEDALADLYEQLEDCTDEAYADIMEQIEVLRAQLDALRAEIEAAASELNAAIYEQLMKGLDEIDALLNELEAIVKGEVEASIEEIKALIAELDAAIEDLLKTIANDVEGTVQGAIQAAVEAIKEQLSYIDGAAEWLEEAVAEAYEAFIDALLEALPYIDEALYDFFYNNPDKVIAFFEENGEFFAENADAVLAVLGYIAVEFGDDALEYVLNNPEEALEQFVSWYEKYGERTWAMILVYLNELGVLDCLPTEEDVKAAIEAIEKQIEDCYKQLENATGEALEELEATIEELKAAVEDLKAMVEDYAQMLDAAVRAEIEAAIEKLENAVAELETAVEELKAAVEAQIEEAIAKAEAAVKEALAKVEEAIAKVEAAVNGVIADVNETIKEVYAALEKAKEELVAGAAQIVENLKDALADLYDVIVENAEKIEAEVLAEILAAIEDIEEALEKLDAIIKGAADAAIEDVAAELKSALAELQDAVEALIEAAEGKADEIVEEAIAAFEQAYLNATTDEYTITKDSYYVAIGDETVLAEPSYADMLAEALEVEYTKIGEEGLTVAGTEAVLMQNIAEIVKADLITLGYSNNTMISFMIDQATSLMPEELDWSVYGYDELGEYVDAALSDITEELYAQGMDAQTTGLMVTAIESYAFAYTGYMVGYPMVVEAIHEINPEALVIMVGMNNALADVTLEAEGVEIELGEYVQYLVDAANIESLAYAMLTGNAIYVDAPAVETMLEAYDVELGTDMITVLQLLAFPQNRALLNPSEAGHDYIKEQILNALNLDYEYLLGDVNLDGEVNSADTNLLFRFVMKRLDEGFTALQMWAGDVNEDGEVNSADTNLLFRYVMKYVPALGAQAQ